MKGSQDNRFFTADPFGSDYLGALCEDLDQATWVRFLVCYFNGDGHQALSPALAKALRHPESKGLVTLTCACGISGLDALWAEAGCPRGKLRCFVPVKKEGPADAKLLHSKMAVLVKPGRSPGDPARVVLYTGSHNWTGPGLRVPGKSNGQLNVEASLRLEMDWDPAWLAEVHRESAAPTHNPVVDALNQIERCFWLESSTDRGDPAAEIEIESWLRDQCKQDIAAPGSTTFIVASGVLGGQVDGASAQSGSRVPPTGFRKLPRKGEWLFVQHFNYQGAEPETFDSASAWALLIWEETADLAAAKQPWLVLCRVRNLGQEDAGSPNLQTVQWLVYDPGHAASTAAGTGGIASQPPASVCVQGHVTRTRVPLEVEHWVVAPVKPETATRALNHHSPARSALLEVVAVRSPRDWVGASGIPSWEGTELPFHAGKQRRARRGFVVHERDGAPSQRRALAMRLEQDLLFGVGISEDAGPTDDVELLHRDVFPCIAPINQVLFAGRDVRGGEAVEPERQRAAYFEVPVDPSVSRGRAERVTRMERLIAPGTPHVAAVLGLGKMELTALGLKK